MVSAMGLIRNWEQEDMTKGICSAVTLSVSDASGSHKSPGSGDSGPGSEDQRTVRSLHPSMAPTHPHRSYPSKGHSKSTLSC